jgi:DNA-nicking Smr family endonuclease
MAKQGRRDRRGETATVGDGAASGAAGALVDEARVDEARADEARAFRAAVRDVKPLAQKPLTVGLVKPSPRVRRRKPMDDTPGLDADMPLVDSASRDGDAIAGGDTLSFQRPGVRTQVVRRLRRGLIPVERELDLHGLTQTAARDQLAHFIAASRDAGCRCVRIIHGKGYRSGARGPILKVAVNLWLRRHLDVMAFTSAKAIDGGTGAVYVLLRA